MLVQLLKLSVLEILPPKSDKSPVMLVQPSKFNQFVILPPKSDKSPVTLAHLLKLSVSVILPPKSDKSPVTLVQPAKFSVFVILPPKSDKSPVMFEQLFKFSEFVILPPKSDKSILFLASLAIDKDVILSKSMQISPLSDFTSNVQLLPCTCCPPYCHTTFVPVAVAVNVPFPCRNWMVFRLSCDCNSAIVIANAETFTPSVSLPI